METTIERVVRMGTMTRHYYFPRSSIIVSVFAIIAWSCETVSSASEFHSSRHGYSIDLPDNWIQIPDDVIGGMIDRLQKSNSKTSIFYDSGFQRDDSSRWLTYPYVLVQIIPYADFGRDRQINEDEFPEVIKSITGRDLVKDIKENLSDEFQDIMSQLETSSPQLDQLNRKYSWTMTMDVKNIGLVRGILVGYFGKESIVQVCYYAKPRAWNDQSFVRKAIVNSLRFDPDTAYSEAFAEANSTRPLWLKILIGAMKGAAIGGALGWAAFLISKRRKKSKNDAC